MQKKLFFSGFTKGNEWPNKFAKISGIRNSSPMLDIVRSDKSLPLKVKVYYATKVLLLN